jgi:hypothetical protein
MEMHMLRYEERFDLGVRSPDEELKNLVRLLNSRAKDSVDDVVRALFENMNEVENAARRLDRDTVDSAFQIRGLRMQGFTVSEARKIQKIGVAFRRAKFTIYPYFRPESGWKFLLVPPVPEASEADALATQFASIYMLGDEDQLWRVRKCLWCGRWFVAKKKKHQCCKPACRLERYLKSPEGRSKRAGYMRRHRVNKKRHDEKERKRALLQRPS